MSNINESLLSNLLSVVTGVALAKKMIKVKSQNPTTSVKAVQKLIDKNPKIKKDVADLKKKSDELEKSLKKQIDGLSPEAQAKMKKLFG